MKVSSFQSILHFKSWDKILIIKKKHFYFSYNWPLAHLKFKVLGRLQTLLQMNMMIEANWNVLKIRNSSIWWLPLWLYLTLKLDWPLLKLSRKLEAKRQNSRWKQKSDVQIYGQKQFITQIFFVLFSTLLAAKSSYHFHLSTEDFKQWFIFTSCLESRIIGN